MVAGERLRAVALVLQALPQLTPSVGVQLAIALPAGVPDLSAGFLAFASVQLKSFVTPDLWDTLARVFTAVPFEKWAAAADSLAQLFVQTVRTDPAAARCCAGFVSAASNAQRAQRSRNGGKLQLGSSDAARSVGSHSRTSCRTSL